MYPQDSINELIIWKKESISGSRIFCQIQINISACVMSSEYLMRTSLYQVRLKIFEWIFLLEDIYIKFKESGLVEIL